MSRFGRQLASDVDAGAAPAAGRGDELGELARAAAAGDPDAAATLLMHVGGPMLKVIRKVLGRGHPDVDDVAQDAAIAFLGALATFRGDCGVAHYASRVALLTALAWRRRLRLRGRWSGNADVGSIQPIEDFADDDAQSPWASALATRRRALIRRLLDELPDVIAESLALHFVLGYTVEEIAAATDVSPNTIWSRLRLGKRALRRKLLGNARVDAQGET